jgi:hypothetical protein
VIAETTLLLTWGVGSNYPGTVWTQLWDLLHHHPSLTRLVVSNVLVWLGPGKYTAAIVVCLLAATAFAVAVAAPQRR